MTTKNAGLLHGLKVIEMSHIMAAPHLRPDARGYGGRRDQGGARTCGR
jgi:hypothetical protein